MATMKETRLRTLLGDNDLRDLTPPPCSGTSFVVRSAAYGATAPTDDLYEAIDLGWQAYKMGESLAEVWDYRGDSANADPTAKPVLLAVVGLIWNEDVC